MVLVNLLTWNLNNTKTSMFKETVKVMRKDPAARGGHLVFFWVGMCRPGLQNGTPFWKKFPLKLIPRSRIRPKTDTPF